MNAAHWNKLIGQPYDECNCAQAVRAVLSSMGLDAHAATIPVTDEDYISAMHNAENGDVWDRLRDDVPVEPDDIVLMPGDGYRIGIGIVVGAAGARGRWNVLTSTPLAGVLVQRVSRRRFVAHYRARVEGSA